MRTKPGRCVVSLAGVLLALGAPATPLGQAAEPAGFDIWPKPGSPPPLAELVSLSPLGSDHMLVDLGFNLTRDGKEWRALQFTRDQTTTAAVPVGKYLFGFIGDEWPHRSVEVLDELRRGRLTALIVDGQSVPISSSGLLDLSTPEKAAAVYNAFPRLRTPGRHSVQYVWEQKQSFFFVLPLGGAPDPLGLGGRRVFVKGEAAGETLDGRMVVTYDLNPACADGLDNDSDGLIDHPDDPGCADPLSDTESAPTACLDTIDNDGDGLVDFPADPGCAGPYARSEEATAGCGDGVDNDGDGLVDHGEDPDCFAATDPSEAAACGDGADNDGDRLVDTADPDCSGPEDRIEAPAPACSDGADNDGDQLVDHAVDPGCDAAHDDTEDTVGWSEPGDFRLLIAVAAASSLNGNVCSGLFTGGDGSLECPGVDLACGVCAAASCGNGMPDDSRLFQVKRSLSGLFLRTDAEFALLRSWQRPTEFACPTSSPVSGSGGWQGGGASSCAGGFDGADLVVSFSGRNFWPLWRSIDGSANYAGAGFPPPLLDAELRATGSRPLTALLDGARAHVDAVRSTDPRADCRPYGVLLLADGGEACAGDPVQAAAALRAAGIRTHVVGYAVPSGAARTELEAVAAAGGTGAAHFVDQPPALSQVLDGIADSYRSESVLVEACNGRDDDCDGVADEEFPGVGQGCDNGLRGVCLRTGVRQCRADGLGTECAVAGNPVLPSAETCNGLDDDCDGFVDEEGVCGSAEICNGLDDDGDGNVDEDFPVGAACNDGAIGVCRGTGTLQCRPDGSSVFCSVTQPGLPPADADLTCDGRDDDCDGTLDEDALGDMTTVGSFRIDRYEASRPDATATDEGRMEHRACSKPGALPWRSISWSEAAARCAAAGKRLCTSQEWEAACDGGVGRLYPYGDVYDGTACNGRDRDAAVDAPSPTGSLARCLSLSGVADVSGNLAEWTATPGSPPEERVVRGGAFDAEAPGLTCKLESDEPEIDFSGWPTLGFRCCSDVP